MSLGAHGILAVIAVGLEFGTRRSVSNCTWRILGKQDYLLDWY